MSMSYRVLFLQFINFNILPILLKRSIFRSIMPTCRSSLVNLFASSLALASVAFSQYATTNGVSFEVNGQAFTYVGTNVYDGMLNASQLFKRLC